VRRSTCLFVLPMSFGLTMRSHIERRRTGLDNHGRELPLEKPLYEIRADEIGVYKDRFVLHDRAPPFLDWLRRPMGETGFFEWARQLFALDSLDSPTSSASRCSAWTKAREPTSTPGSGLPDYPARWRR